MSILSELVPVPSNCPNCNMECILKTSYGWICENCKYTNYDVIEKNLPKLPSNEILGHIVMYAKGWYKMDEEHFGLKVMVSCYCGMGLQYVSENTLFEFFMSMIKNKRIPLRQSFDDIIFELFRESIGWFRTRESLTKIDVINGILRDIHLSETKDFPWELPKPNPELFPLKEK